nr:MAG TPA: hypothetical protein [Caudoviricetes sp.]
MLSFQCCCGCCPSQGQQFLGVLTHFIEAPLLIPVQIAQSSDNFKELFHQLALNPTRGGWQNQNLAPITVQGFIPTLRTLQDAHTRDLSLKSSSSHIRGQIA